ncbi:hypothetical protein CFELI_09760 [Corynebacterium felinum]|nr:hypothetical protein CFELI_09760 [Corynebacterium felinum]
MRKSMKIGLAGVSVAAVGYAAVAVSSLIPFESNNLSEPMYGENRADTGMFTISCQVLADEKTHPLRGYIFGNSEVGLHGAEEDAELYLSKFGFDVDKHNCQPHDSYHPSGAYDARMNPL